jgi:hypothetical protein
MGSPKRSDQNSVLALIANSSSEPLKMTNVAFGFPFTRRDLGEVWPRSMPLTHFRALVMAISRPAECSRREALQ